MYVTGAWPEKPYGWLFMGMKEPMTSMSLPVYSDSSVTRADRGAWEAMASVSQCPCHHHRAARREASALTTRIRRSGAIGFVSGSSKSGG